MGPSLPLSQLHHTFPISFHINSNPIRILFFKSIPIPKPLTPPKPHPQMQTPPSPISTPTPCSPGPHVLLPTVRCSQDPAGVDEDCPAEQPPLNQQGCLPGLRVGRAGVAAWEKSIGPIGAVDNLGIVLRDAW